MSHRRNTCHAAEGGRVKWADLGLPVGPDCMIVASAFQFRLRGSSRCNGIAECADLSDEAGCEYSVWKERGQNYDGLETDTEVAIKHGSHLEVICV